MYTHIMIRRFFKDLQYTTLFSLLQRLSESHLNQVCDPHNVMQENYANNARLSQLSKHMRCFLVFLYECLKPYMDPVE